MKSEFRDKCCQLRLNDLSDVEMWHEVMRKISDSILISFSSFLLLSESQLRSLENSYISTGPADTSATLLITPLNFGPLFLAKENIAVGFLMMNMFDDCYAIYEELHVLYHSILNEATRLGDKAPDISILTIGSIYSNPEQSQLKTNVSQSFEDKLQFRSTLRQTPVTASILDCEVHIISSKLQIMLMQKRYELALGEATDFLQFMSILMMNDGRVSAKDCAIWLYSLSMCIFELISSKLEKEQMEEEFRKRMSTRLGELLFNAKRQLECLGSALGIFDSGKGNRYQTLSMFEIRSIKSSAGNVGKIDIQNVLDVVRDGSLFGSFYIVSNFFM